MAHYFKEFAIPSSPSQDEQAQQMAAEIYQTENPHEQLDMFADWIEDEGLYTTELLHKVRAWACVVRFWLDLANTDYGLHRFGDEITFHRHPRFRVANPFSMFETRGDDASPEPIERITVDVANDQVVFQQLHPSYLAEEVYEKRRFLFADRRWIVKFRFAAYWYISVGERPARAHDAVLRRESVAVVHNTDSVTALLLSVATQHIEMEKPLPTLETIRQTNGFRFNSFAHEKRLRQSFAYAVPREPFFVQADYRPAAFDTHIINRFDI